MYIKKNFGVKGLIAFSGHHIVWLSLWAISYTAAFEYLNLKWMIIPWVPLAVIGTAVAFYVGFKNNSAYDRMWEAREVWEAIINTSRMWSPNVRAYVSNQFTDENYSDAQINEILKKLVYRHIAWLYTLRSQLLIPTPWEHIKQNYLIRTWTKKKDEKLWTRPL